MRDAFVEAVVELCRQRDDIVLLTGDLGFGVLDGLRRDFPGQFMNVGVAEQNLAGVGAGLALAGQVVFTYSIGNFPTLRCLEQIRNDICYHGANVNIVTVGGGMAYGALGPSHFATEDLGIMRMLPGMTVVAPADPHEVRCLVPQIVAHQGPVYLRLGRAGEPTLHDPHTQITLGVPTSVRDGERVLLLSAGGMLETALLAAGLLEGEGVSCEVVSVHTLKPLDEDAIVEMAQGKELVVTVEEHSRLGGLGGAVAEVLADAVAAPRLHRFGLPSAFPEGIGSQDYLRRVNGLDAGALVAAVQRELGVSSRSEVAR